MGYNRAVQIACARSSVDRASACGAEGRRFESYRARQSQPVDTGHIGYSLDLKRSLQWLKSLLLKIDGPKVVDHERDHPDVLLQFLEPDFLPGEDLGQVDLLLVHADPSARSDQDRLVVALCKVIEQTGLTQTKVAEILRLGQPTISKFLRGRTNGFTRDRLVGLLNLIGQDVNISVRRQRTQGAHVNKSVAQLT